MVTIDECHPVLFPTIRQILVLLATLPVSIALAERSFSTLRRYAFCWLSHSLPVLML
ncbi:52 kDa repressor of the inhibitor of the protein kinase-like, partial [Aphis craccivora]